ncbi:hypothetical protein TNCV_4394271 [Trichonephila clavipes]|uniref:Uncharacterized protein n=1 Tax=Trichonephila clavipes TaxID=2585209 RepID=A0A8X6W4K5_TRICX|nr:hypothetical protein TNCV_4394271 [Trichonephila clavipes]
MVSDVHEIHPDKELDVRLSLTVAVRTMHVTVRFGFGSNPILKESNLEVIRGLPPLFPFHQPYERSCDSTAI